MPGRRLAYLSAGLAALLVAAGGADAAPLCRDTKGLFTPCPHAANHRARAILAGAAPAPVAKPRAIAAPQRQRDDAAPVRKVRLCTDIKGLFTPCPR